jgi:tetratricopeptide (TPR) repeat protein
LEATAIQAAEPVVRLLKQEASPEKLAQATDQAAKRRRRRRLAWLSAAGLLMLVALSTLGGLWWTHRRAALREEVNAKLAEAAHLRECGQFQQSRELLEETLKSMGNSGPSDLAEQASMELSDVRLVGRLDDIRQRLFDREDAGSPLDFPEMEKEYAAALSEAVLVREGEEKDVVAARVRNSSVRVEALAAIQDWAAATSDEPRRAWLLAIACAADPDPARDSLRRPELWRDGNALAQLGSQPVPKSLSAELAVALALRALSANVPVPRALLVEVQKDHPEDYWLNTTTGWCLGRSRKLDEAATCLRTAISIRPCSAAAHFNLGITLRVMKKLDEAMAEFNEALRLDPNSASAHNGKGIVLDDEEKLDEAIEQFKEAIRLNPKHATAHVNLGVRLTNKKQVDEAISHFEAALGINPNHSRAHSQYGNALRAKNKLDEAIGHCQEAVRLAPGDAAAHNALGNAWHAKNQYDQAIPCYERAIHIDPANASFRSNLGNSLRLKGRLDEAIARFKEALDIDSKNASAHNGMGNALSDKGDPDGAIPYHKKAIDIDPNNARFHANLGGVLWSLGRHDAAIIECNKALAIDSTNSATHTSLGRSFLGKGQLDEAFCHFEKALELDGNNASARGNLALARLFGQGRTADASRELQDAATKNPNDALIQFNVGQALLANGQFVEAREAVRRALERSAPGQRYRDHFLQTMRQLEDVNRLSAMEVRLPAILEKKEKPADAAEALKFAWLCQVKLRFAAAAGLYTDSFAADPKPANELSAGYRFNAARCAALAAAGWGLDSPKPSDAERVWLREQALEWQRADLTAWQKQIELANHETRSAVRRTLALWLSDFRFFAVREKAELAKLPDTERTSWEKLWADTEALRLKAQAAREAERWASPDLRVVQGLELWLDAARLNAAREAGGLGLLKADDEVEAWFDSSGKGSHVSQAVPAARPRLVRVGEDWLVRFDGADDHLRCTGLGRSLDACTVFVVAAPQANPGGFRAFLAANEAGRCDYETGFNIDLGPGKTAGFDCLSVEGRGFGGACNLLNPPGPFGTLHVLEVVVAPGTKAVRLFLDGKPSGERPFAPAPLGFNEITVGARYTTFGAGPLGPGGFLQGDIAEVLVYNRTLSADETEAVQQYLDRKYARLREALPPR